MKEPAPLIRVRSLSKSYAGPGGITIHALRDCSLDIDGGSFTVIVGKSGGGKTTLLKLIAGLEEPGSGTVEFSAAGKPGASHSAGETPEELSGPPGESEGPPGEPSAPPKLGFMFQDPRLLPWLTVEENLALALPRPRNKAEKAEVHNEIHRALALTGLADRAASRPGELSGGMAQRAALARCLCRNPDVLLLDEPLSSLDAVTRLRLREELERLWQQLGLTVIMVTHDIEEAVFFGEQVFLINQGAMESTMPIPLKRPRDYHGAEFHEYCRRIEEELCRNPVSQP